MEPFGLVPVLIGFIKPAYHSSIVTIQTSLISVTKMYSRVKIICQNIFEILFPLFIANVKNPNKILSAYEYIYTGPYLVCAYINSFSGLPSKYA